ncbi:MAG: hypothetical protein K2H09_08115, partial [Treponemataceae bacterium]|nr:hypothetical protein [Treponemataceae bacterium]
TYALYMAADNNLERFALKNIREIKENLGDKKINFIVLLDRTNGYDKTEGNWTDTKILELHADTEINNDVVIELGEKDTSDISTLSEFLELATTYYPSNNFALNVWSHGFGVYPDCKIYNGARSLMQDYTTGYSDDCSFSIIAFANAIKKFNEIQNKKINILQFDCCLMQMIEILWQLKDCADFIIGSEAELPGTGSNYATLYKNLTSNSTVKNCAYAIIKDFEEKYKNTVVSCTYSVADMDKFRTFADLFQNFLDEIFNSTSIDFALIKNDRKNVYNYDSHFIEYVDLKSFFSIFRKHISDHPYTEEIFSQLIQKYDEFIFASCITNSYSEKASGVGINIPHTEKQYSYYNQNADDYLDIYKDTALGSIIEKIVLAG